MFRIDSEGATPENGFKSSPPPATIVTGQWLTATQEEICNVIELLGTNPLNPLDSAQMAQAINQFVNATIASALSDMVSYSEDATGQLQIGPVILKWGGGSEGGNVFAEPFPTACWRVVFALTNNPDDGDESDEVVRIISKDQYGFNVATSGDHLPATFDWFAIGH
ncbi:MULTISPECIES: hypothetical protein [unclassified Sphingobium]|uniref:gp53-like domain-containing protein n=1 Tax=unclassified Sphingobium TaxID=2611147 RepID=UPI0035A5786F